MKYIFWTLIAAFAVMGVVFWQEWTESQRRLADVKRRQQNLESEVAHLQQEKAGKLAYLERIQNDPEFFRREARQRLGSATPGEIIIKSEPPVRSTTR